MTTDTAKLAERFSDIRQEWGLQPGETETRAQNEALESLHRWLQTGAENPEVIIRAVQVLMSNPERPGVHKRPAVKHVFRQIAQSWASAGFREQDVLLLQGMILAAWPYGSSGNAPIITRLLDSAWTAVTSNQITYKEVAKWRNPPHEEPQPPRQAVGAEQQSPQAAHENTEKQFKEAPDIREALAVMERSNDDYTANLAKHSVHVFRAHNEFLQDAVTHIQRLDQELMQNKLLYKLKAATEQTATAATLGLLWWGQSKYSTSTHTPYRRMSNAAERLWWMAWDCSALSVRLDVEPAAAFFVETLYQLGGKLDAPKRALKEWMAELVSALRRIQRETHAPAVPVGFHLDKIAREDSLGLPVTWARIEAHKSQVDEIILAERICNQVAIDPETEIDLGDWASWIFREALLDRYLGAR